jgi:chromosome segregation ATPase
MEADVRSIDAVRDWHATLANYADSLSEALAGVEMEIRRAYEWLDEQLALWQQAIRDSEEEVTRAKAELAQRKFKTWDDRDPDCTVQERALRRAKARLEHAEEQVETVRRWIGRLPKIIDETYRGAGRRLQNFLEDELPKGQMDLARRIASLEVYAGLRPDFASGGLGGSGTVPAPPTSETAAKEGASP